MLPHREELEYSLPTDERPYKACPMSRWDNNLINLLFGSSLRSLRMLRAAKLSFLASKGAEETFKTDLQAILDASVEDFENAFAYQRHGGAKSLLEVFAAPEAKVKHPAVYAALKHLLLQTATVPLTEGNKMKMRHESFSQTLRFGTLKVFMTTNFADCYSPLLLKLYNSEDAGEADELLGGLSVNLFDDAPSMPTQQRMHQIVARHPSVQARLFC